MNPRATLAHLKSMVRSLLLLSLAAGAFGQATYEIDPQHSAAQFSVKHMMVSTVRGHMGKPAGTIQYDAAKLDASKVTATVDVTGINTNEAKRDAHLKSADFFDIEKFPKMTFESTKWWKDGDKVKIAGNLTIHGVTKPVTLDAEISPVVKNPQGGSRVGGMATTKLNRKDYGLNWNRALEAGGVLVGDEITVTLDIEAVSR